jgi:hypothetical protein
LAKGQLLDVGGGLASRLLLLLLPNRSIEEGHESCLGKVLGRSAQQI